MCPTQKQAELSLVQTSAGCLVLCEYRAAGISRSNKSGNEENLYPNF
jgi:hypothetical protein